MILDEIVHRDVEKYVNYAMGKYIGKIVGHHCDINVTQIVSLGSDNKERGFLYHIQETKIDDRGGSLFMAEFLHQITT